MTSRFCHSVENPFTMIDFEDVQLVGVKSPDGSPSKALRNRVGNPAGTIRRRPAGTDPAGDTLLCRRRRQNLAGDTFFCRRRRQRQAAAQFFCRISHSITEPVTLQVFKKSVVKYELITLKSVIGL